MGAHYVSQIWSNHNHHRATHQNASFSGPARQTGAGVGWLGRVCHAMERVAIPVLRRYILSVAKQLGRNLLEAAVPEGGQVSAGKKRPSGKMLKHVAKTATKKSVKISAVMETERRANTDEKQTWTKCQGYDY